MKQTNMDTTNRENETGEWGHSTAQTCAGSEAFRSVREGIHSATNYVSNTAKAAQRRITELRDGGFEKVKADVLSYTREQPINALLVAAGVGVLLGIIFGLRRR